jgi:hypothetical protein
LQQNHVPVIRQLTLVNTSQKDWEQVTVGITAEPEFILPARQHLAALKAGEQVELKNISVQVSPKFLAELTEKTLGNLRVSVKAGEEEVFSGHYPIELLAYDQWNGMGLLPGVRPALVPAN